MVHQVRPIGDQSFGLSVATTASSKQSNPACRFRLGSDERSFGLSAITRFAMFEFNYRESRRSISDQTGSGANTASGDCAPAFQWHLSRREKIPRGFLTLGLSVTTHPAYPWQYHGLSVTGLSVYQWPRYRPIGGRALKNPQQNHHIPCIFAGITRARDLNLRSNNLNSPGPPIHTPAQQGAPPPRRLTPTTPALPPQGPSYGRTPTQPRTTARPPKGREKGRIPSWNITLGWTSCCV
jgi:hypothetical protein